MKALILSLTLTCLLIVSCKSWFQSKVDVPDAQDTALMIEKTNAVFILSSADSSIFHHLSYIDDKKCAH